MGYFTAKRGSKIGFYATKDAKKIISLANGHKDYILVGNNDDELQFFEIPKN